MNQKSRYFYGSMNPDDGAGLLTFKSCAALWRNDLFLFSHRMLNPFSNFSITAILMLLISSCAVSKQPEAVRFRALQKGSIADDSSYVYSLPYETGKKHLIVQGYFSRFTHRNRAAIDFKMKRGTPIYAARGGVVTRVKEDGDKGGLDRNLRQYGNSIVINHSDNTRAGYWHLQYNGVLVNVGDTVQQGQLIGYSGKTGYSAFPHLHFIVWRSEAGGWRQIGTRFQTKNGVKYLRPFRSYRRPNEQQ